MTGFEEVSAALRQMGKMGYSDFLDAIDEQAGPEWKHTFIRMQKGFLEGFFSMEKQKQALLWQSARDWAEEERCRS